MALNRKTFPKVTAAVDTFTPSEHFNTVLYTGNGGTQRIGGYINRGAVFNGSNSKIDISPISGLSDVSFSCWLNSTDTSSSGRRIIELNSDTSSNGWAGTLSVIYTPSTGSILIRSGNASNSETSILTHTDTSLRDGDWHHLVVTRNETTSVTTLYIDGSQADQETVARISAVGAGTRLGGSHYSAGAGWLGKLDQVRIFNKAISSSEVTTLYGETHASTTISTTDIFDDDSGVALYQLDGNANDTGGVSGKFGSGAIFNGSSSNILLPNALILNTEDISVSFWVKDVVAPASSYRTIYQGDGNDYFYITVDTSGEIRVYPDNYQDPTYSRYTTELATTSSNITDGDWHHIVVVNKIESSANGGGYKIYVDGSENASASFSSTLRRDSGNNTNGSSIGSNNAGTAQYFEGKIDDVRVYSDALTSAEVGYIYNNTTASIPTDNLEAYYKLDGDARDEQQLYDGVASNVTYAYDGTASNVTYQEATKFSPDLVWIKNRTSAQSHRLIDSVRGSLNLLFSDLTNANDGPSSSYPSIVSNGFQLNSTESNASSTNYVAWCFNAGTAAAASNTDGSITSTVKANTEAGFSIVKFTKTAGNSTVGHGLGVKPSLVITKKTNGTGGWTTYTDVTGSHGYLQLNTTAAFTAYGSAPNTSTFNNFNDTGDEVICYVFADVDGYQKIGSYTSDGSDGDVFVDTGFQPAFLMIKNIDSAHDWMIYDNKRDTTNPNSSKLSPNTSGAEYANSAIDVDFASDGFVIRGTDDAINDGSEDFIYLAIAADPDETTPTVENSFDVVTYTGGGSSAKSVDLDFKPDFTWIKARNATLSNVLHDSIRGAGSLLLSNTTNAEITNGSNTVTFTDNGFDLEGGANHTSVNGSNNYVAWCWKAGDHDDSLPEINTNGTIDSVVSVNDAAGFSIVKYTGNSGATKTIGHGLSSAPELIIVKNISDGAQHWSVYSSATGNAQVGHLNLTNAFSSSGDWGSTTPTSTVFTIGSGDARTNSNGEEHIAYCFKSITGYQKVGSYTGTGSAVTVTTGFAPRFVMIKRTDSSGDWVIYDNQRGGTKLLFPHLSNAEGTYTSTYNLTFNSNGFSISSGYAASGGTYIYLAIK